MGRTLQNHENISKLIDDYGLSILHLAYSFVRNRQTAEDLSQEIFIKCFEKLDSFKGESNIQTWLYRIAINHCKDYLRSWHYRKVQVSEYASTLFSKNEVGPEDLYLKKINNTELINDIFKLPVKYREIIILYYFHEISLKEIAEINSINLNTAKSRMTRAKEILKRHIQERSNTYGQSNKRSERSITKG